MRTKVSFFLSLFAAAALTAGCTLDDDDLGKKGDDVDQPDDGDEDGDGDPEDCECKIEGEAIGEVGYVVHIDHEVYVFEGWIEKEDAPGEYVGFVLSENADGLDYEVKTGTTVYAGTGVEWIHPGGLSGPTAQGISYVDLCEDDDGPIIE